MGRRFLSGRSYDAITTTDFAFVAVIEFASRDDLLAYLDHPAHEALGRQFYQHAERAAAYDIEMIDGADARQLLS